MPTHNHPSTIAHAAASVLDQSVSDLQLVIIGDGVGDDTRDIVADLRRSDKRISFVDRPKVPGRNEQARHAVVSESVATLITYLGDDDLFLAHHLESMQELLADHDFAHPFPVFVQTSGDLEVVPTDLADARCVSWHLQPGHNAVSLSGAAHTHDLYRRLPFGWRPAPERRWSDHYMWGQIFTLAGVRLATSSRATTVKLPSDQRAGVDGAGRAEEIRSWLDRIRSAGFERWWDAAVTDAIRRTAVDQTRGASQLSEELFAVRSQHDQELTDVRLRHGEESAEQGRSLSDERRRRMEAEHATERLRGEYAALAAEHHRVTSEMGRVAGTLTWRLRSRLLRHPIIGPMIARRPGA
jgi:hypothetical protein